MKKNAYYLFLFLLGRLFIWNKLILFVTEFTYIIDYETSL